VATLQPGTTVPIPILPTADFAQQIPDEELRQVLLCVRPYAKSSRKWSVPDLLHALRLWGHSSSLPGPHLHKISEEFSCPTSQQIVEVLTSNRCFRERFPDCEFDLLTRTEFGVAVFLQAPTKWVRQVPGCQSHIDKWLACMAETNVPLTAEIETASGPGTVADVLRESQMRFELSGEIEWTTVAISRYYPSPEGWTNRFGKHFTFDSLAQHLLAAPRHRGSCFGIHKLLALVSLLRVHQQVPVLSERIDRAVRDHLREVAHELQRFQHEDGSWTARWSSVEGESDPPGLPGRQS
jgi:hypothetical protein